MTTHRVLISGLAALLVTGPSASARERSEHEGSAHVIRVPRDHATVQAAVDAAHDGDRIEVGRIGAAEIE